ncbi:glutamyl-tRNA reductase [Staphylococcus gallinarum]|uniref:Glutamyl-tRNA reductase n=1 Tax=Staphylococcus gallinarum TaxID=1293 RepID=A0A380FJ32_STAGA|nr:glutamyl-tRNA reductase [Staphylococcus gallinarum]
MHLIAVSINHRTADVALREKVAFKDDAIRSANVDLFETKSILENVILSTCNRYRSICSRRSNSYGSLLYSTLF